MQGLRRLFAIPLVLATFTFLGLTWIYQAAQLLPAVAFRVPITQGIVTAEQKTRQTVTHTYKVTPNFPHSNPQHKFSFQCTKNIISTSSIELAIDPNTIENGGEVTVQWRGASGAQSASKDSTDWIGLFCPGDAPASSCHSYWVVNQSAHGEVGFIAYNVREECEFRYYSSNRNCTLLLGRSALLKFHGGANQPTQGHIALTGDPSEMRIQWTSGTNATPTVTYGYSPSRLLYAAKGVSRTYSAHDMCTRPATDPNHFIDPGFLHDVLLTGLKQDSTIFYKYGSTQSTGKVYNFTTPPPHGSKDPFSFVTYGDMGLSLSHGAKDTMTHVLQEIRKGAKFVLHQGDLSYALGYAYIWEQWMSLIEPIATRVPYMVGIGNHEQDYLTGQGGDGFHPSWGNYGGDSGGECGVPTRYRFHMPDNGYSVNWYSFNYGQVHFTFMSTEHNFTTGSEQYHWLERDLANVDRNHTPWLIIVGHRPMYSSEVYPSDYKVTLHMQSEGLEDLFHRYQVDMALWGHYHSYERTCKVYKQQCREDGIVNIVIGAAGASLDSTSQYKVGWSKHLEMNYGYGRVLVANDTALLWEYVRNMDGVVSDQVWLKK